MQELQMVLLRDWQPGLWRIFSLDSQTLNKISIAATYSLPTSKSIGTWIDLGMKRYRTFNSV
jgi:hypothetical protein